MARKNPAAVALGRISTPKKAQAARENGKKGGRPRIDLDALSMCGIRASTGYNEDGAERCYGWYAWTCLRRDVQNEHACTHTHRSEDAAEQCARRLQRVWYGEM